MLRGLAGPLLAISLSLLPPSAAAQDASDSAAYRALTQTPPGAFALSLGPAITGRRGTGPTISGRYGLMSFRSNDYIHNFGLGVDGPVARGRLGLTIGRYGPTCPRDDCPGHLMAAVAASQPLAAVTVGRTDNSAALNIGLDASAGYARPRSTGLLSGAALVTFALVPRPSGVRLLPYIAPGVGVGLTHVSSNTDAGMLPMLDLGVGLLAFGDRLGVSAGARRVFLSGGNWVAGLSAGWTLH
jgi:hypothetical protein